MLTLLYVNANVLTILLFFAQGKCELPYKIK